MFCYLFSNSFRRVGDGVHAILIYYGLDFVKYIMYTSS